MPPVQGKRGIEKPPFQLPEYIANTGITKLRNATKEADEKKKLKSKTRDRMAPKMGGIEIDYQVCVGCCNGAEKARVSELGWWWRRRQRRGRGKGRGGVGWGGGV